MTDIVLPVAFTKLTENVLGLPFLGNVTDDGADNVQGGIGVGVGVGVGVTV